MVGCKIEFYSHCIIAYNSAHYANLINEENVLDGSSVRLELSSSANQCLGHDDGKNCMIDENVINLNGVIKEEGHSITIHE